MPHRSLMRPSGSPSGFAGINGLSSRHFLKLVEDSIDVGLWSASIDSDVLQASIGLYRVLGLDPQLSLTFGHLADLMHPEDRRLHSSLLALLRSGQAVKREFRIIRPDRSQRWISSRAEVILGKNDRPSHALGIVRDITDLRQAWRATEVEHDRFKALVDATAAVLWISKPNGEAQDMPQWRELTGQTTAEMQGAGWLAVVHPDDRARARLAWQNAVAEVATYNTDYRVLCRDGLYRWFNARGVPIVDQEGSVREWIGVCLSIADHERPGLQPTRTGGPGRSGPGDPKITAAQIRAARAMIDLSAEDLARGAGVSVSTVRRLEDESLSGQARDRTLQAVRVVLEAAGVSFTFAPRSGVQLSG